MGVQEWTAEDIKKAREYFLSGFSIKDIAKQLGRSPTATNKALSRFRIRIEKPRINPTQESMRSKYQAENPIISPSFERKELRKELENWISFWQLCEFLSNENICIYEVSPTYVDLKDRQFRVGTKLLNAAQLLLTANKIRTEKNMNAFLVKDLSW